MYGQEAISTKGAVGNGQRAIDEIYVLQRGTIGECICLDETDPAANKFLAVTLAEIDLIEAYRHAGAETQAAIRAILHI